MTGDITRKPLVTLSIHENFRKEESEPCVSTPLHLPSSATWDFSEKINVASDPEIAATRSLSDVSHGISFASSTGLESEFPGAPLTSPFDASRMNTSAGRVQNLGHIPGMMDPEIERTYGPNSNHRRKRFTNVPRDVPSDGENPPHTRGVRRWAWLFNMHRSVVGLFSRSRTNKGSGFDASGLPSPSNPAFSAEQGKTHFSGQKHKGPE